jgi:hypothetical protein
VFVFLLESIAIVVEFQPELPGIADELGFEIIGVRVFEGVRQRFLSNMH